MLVVQSKWKQFYNLLVLLITKGKIFSGLLIVKYGSVGKAYGGVGYNYMLMSKSKYILYKDNLHHYCFLLSVITTYYISRVELNKQCMTKSGNTEVNCHQR
ncbi:hypothetical protein Hanom_Chr09g00801331 [Helianthus anomalus]